MSSSVFFPLTSPLTATACQHSQPHQGIDIDALSEMERMHAWKDRILSPEPEIEATNEENTGPTTVRLWSLAHLSRFWGRVEVFFVTETLSSKYESSLPWSLMPSNAARPLKARAAGSQTRRG
ncbi:hypothetical protein CPB86DRAFT_812490 [Serendipita vermifera]|nr:hypothetical protein CPB86DRAFT_812490 [Serendipita vermifera]